MLLLRAWTGGDQRAGDDLFARLYDDLRAVAARRLRAESASPMQTTELVHEAFLRLVDQKAAVWHDRSQFFAVAARVMRRILIDDARARLSEKRGSGSEPLPLTAAGSERLAETPRELLALDRALDDLEKLDPDRARLVELRFFVGLSLEDTAAMLGQSRATIVRRWRVTKGWLHQQLAAEA